MTFNITPPLAMKYICVKTLFLIGTTEDKAYFRYGKVYETTDPKVLPPEVDVDYICLIDESGSEHFMSEEYLSKYFERV